MPRWARSGGGTASRSRPLNRILPPAGATVPEIALNRVVLPAPFGPTIATNCPSLTVSDTPRSAASPPYLTERSWISSIGHQRDEHESRIPRPVFDRQMCPILAEQKFAVVPAPL